MKNIKIALKYSDIVYVGLRKENTTSIVNLQRKGDRVDIFSEAIECFNKQDVLLEEFMELVETSGYRLERLQSNRGMISYLYDIDRVATCC